MAFSATAEFISPSFSSKFQNVTDFNLPLSPNPRADCIESVDDVGRDPDCKRRFFFLAF